MKNLVTVLVVLYLAISVVLAGSTGREQGVIMDESSAVISSKPIPPPPPDLPPLTLVGTYTTLQGFYDYQCNGGAAQHIRVNPANQNIHVVYMADPDTPAVSGNPNRGTYYAFSTNGGSSWNNFGNLRIPTRRSGYPTLDLGQGSLAGAALVADHSVITTSAGQQGTVFVDFPEGTGAFVEISPPTGFGSDEPEWPYVAGASDGSVVMKVSRNGAATNHYSRTADLVSWSPLAAFPGTNSQGGRYPTHANGTGRVGILLQAVANGTFFLESTNNGQTWPSTAQTIHPPARVVGVDSFQSYVGADFIYNGNTPLFVVDELSLVTTEPAQISFYSAATGWKTIASRSNTPNVPAARNRAQVNHYTVGYPAIGLSGSTIVVVYTAMQSETSAVGFNYCDIFAVKSNNGGSSWSRPYNVTQTPNVDERYPAISPWNQSGFANITWQEDPVPGSAAFSDAAPFSRARQKYLKLDLSLLVGVKENPGETATGFRLAQNYPNPFNPATKIDYNVAKSGLVTIKVYDVLGQEVATLLNEELRPGSYQVTFDGSKLASGIYMYTMTANGFSESRKMMLLK